jgi:hypothetical protein
MKTSLLDYKKEKKRFNFPKISRLESPQKSRVWSSGLPTNLNTRQPLRHKNTYLFHRFEAYFKKKIQTAERIVTTILLY